MFDRLTLFANGPKAMRWTAMTIAFVLVASIASVGQVNSRHESAGLASGDGVDTTSDTEFGVGGSNPANDPNSADKPGDAGDGPGGDGSDNGPGPGPGVTTSTTLAAPGSNVDWGLRTQGVTDSQVTLGVSYNTTGCGDAGTLQTMLGATTTGDIEKSLDAFTRYINDTGGIGGRKLKIDIADDGGGGCPEKALAAARKMVDDDKVFAVIPGLHEVADYAASKHVPTFIGRDDPRSLQRYGPNGIGLTEAIGDTLDAWSAFGDYYLDSRRHVACLIHPESGVSGDWELYKKLLVADMAEHGIHFKDTVVYKEDVSTAQQQSSAAAARMKSKGCQQVYFMAGNPIALIFFTKAATTARWYPTWTFTSYMALADSALGGGLMDQTQWKKAVGLSTRVPPGHHPAEGNCKRIYERYYQGDGQSESAATQLVCAELLSAAEAMRRGVKLTGRLDANSLLVGADNITNDFYFDATVPLDWNFPKPPGPYKTKAFSHYTVVKWNGSKSDYDFPEFPLYWKRMGPGQSGGVDLRALFKPYRSVK